MSKIVYRKIFSNLTFTVVLSAVIGNVLYKNQVYFSFLLVFFSFANLLISWLYYLKLDGFTIPLGEGLLNLLSKDASLNNRNYWFNSRKKEENDEFVHLDISPKTYGKITMWCCLASGIILMIISFIVYRV